MFAVDSTVLTPFKKLYGMVLCTRDVVPDDCNRCLATAVAPNCCNEKEGGWIISRSCTIRFEVYPVLQCSRRRGGDVAGAAPPEAGRSTAAAMSRQEALVSQSLLTSAPYAF